jgi:hypothetical protein
MSHPNEILDDIAKIKERVRKGPFSGDAKERMMALLDDTAEELKDDVW